MQETERNNGNGVHGGSTPNSVDISALLANMVALLQQLLASIANKEEAIGTPWQDADVKMHEKTKTEKKELPQEFAE
jgi:hypothetical protein